MEAPRITIYYRMLDNLDGSPVTNFIFLDISRENYFNFGQINTIKGGQSPYIIEFDIWNNESAFSGGMLPSSVKDARNCTFEVWDDEKLSTVERISKNGIHFVQARCITVNKNASWQPIAGINSLRRQNIFGNINPTNPGILSGQPGGDHTIIQVKVVIPPSEALLGEITEPNEDNQDTTQSGIHDFKCTFNFEYEYEDF